MLLALHKLSLLLCVILGILNLFNKNAKIKLFHGWSGFIALISILLYLFQMNTGQNGYIIYMLIMTLTVIIPYLCKQKKSTVIHIATALSSLVWLVFIHL